MGEVGEVEAIRKGVGWGIMSGWERVEEGEQEEVCRDVWE